MKVAEYRKSVYVLTWMCHLRSKNDWALKVTIIYFLTFHQQGHFNFFKNFVQFLGRIYKSLSFSFGMQKFYSFNFHFKCSNTTRNFSTNYFNLVPREFWFKLRFDLFEFRLINSSITSSSTVKKKLVSKLNTYYLLFSWSKYLNKRNFFTSMIFLL